MQPRERLCVVSVGVLLLPQHVQGTGALLWRLGSSVSGDLYFLSFFPPVDSTQKVMA